MRNDGDGTGYVFKDCDGGPLRRANVVGRSLNPILKRAGLPRIRFHALRHCHASLLLSQGIHPKIVQERLGHASIDVTLDTYSHLMHGLDEAAAVALDGMNLTGPQKKKPAA